MFSRHGRFLTAFGIGLAVKLGCLGLPLGGLEGLLLAVNGFFLAYLLLMLHFARKVTPEDLRRHVQRSDEGLPLILALALGTVAVSLAAIGMILSRPGSSTAEAGLALASVPLGWAMVQVLAAFHYAGLFYTPAGQGDAGGLAFPATPEPGAWDFLYFAFGVGMTAQVADVVVETARLRRVVLVHSVASFFYNTVILALAVNAAVGMG